MYDYATVVRVVEEEVGMTVEEAWKLISRHFLWRGDLSRMYDDEGYAAASPEMRRTGRGADDLRHVGRYPPPEAVMQLVREICATVSASWPLRRHRSTPARIHATI